MSKIPITITPLPRKPITSIWVTRDKQRIRVCDLTDSHLLAAELWVRRAAKKMRDNELKLALDAQARYGDADGADWFAANDISALEGDPNGEQFYPPIYDDLLTEIMRRGLVPKED